MNSSGNVEWIDVGIEKKHHFWCFVFSGRKDGIWTHDPYVPNVVLYQAEPPSDAVYYIKLPLKTQDLLCA